MQFNLGLVGHTDTIQLVTKLVKEYFDHVEVFPEEFGHDQITQDAVERVARLQTKCHGILYSRRDPYLLISEHLQHIIPTSYVEVHGSHLLISLLEATISYGMQPTRLSVDGLNRVGVMQALQTVGLSAKQVEVFMVNTSLRQADLVNSTLAQHIKNYEAGAELCITNITDVCSSLRKKQIPAIVINPTPKSFIHEIRNLMLRHQLSNQTMNPLAVIHIRLQYKEKYRFADKIPLREVEELSNAMKLITIFSEDLDGAMYTLGRYEYLILCTGTILQNTTDQYANISLMQKINTTTVFNVTLGIGYGETVKEAERNAVIATDHTLLHRGTNTMVALGADQLIGPLRPKSEHFTEESVLDVRLEEIAQNTGLSTNVLNQLLQITIKQNSALVTSAELAKTLDVSRRTVNRILERLLEKGYASIEGKHLAQPKGRPARVIRLIFK